MFRKIQHFELILIMIFRHENLFFQLSPLSVQLGPITKYARTAVKTDYKLTSKGLVVKESIPKDFVSESIPADVPQIVEYR